MKYTRRFGTDPKGPAQAAIHTIQTPAINIMIKSALFLLLLLALSWVSQARAAETIELTVDVPGAPAWRSEGDGRLPEISGLPLLRETGMPRLPYRDVDILLPAGTEIYAVEVSAAATDFGPISGSPLKALPIPSSEGGNAKQRMLNQDGESFPAQWGHLLGTSDWHGYRIAHLRIYPLRLQRQDRSADWSRFDHATHFDLSIELKSAEKTASVIRRRAVPGEDEHIRETLGESLLNPSAMSSYGLPIAPSTPRGLVGFAPTSSPSLEGSPVLSVIITVAELEASFQGLADYKTAHGMPTVVKTIDWITQNYLPSADLQTTIRTFITDAYETWGTRFVMLGGDVELIPTRMIFNELYPSGEGSDLPVDLYYACLDGNWNADGDEILGEPYYNSYDPGDDVDLVAEINLGRAPVKTVAEADLFVQKVITYERDGVGDHYGKILFLSEVLFPQDYAAGDSIQDDGASYSEEIINTVLSGKAVNWDRFYEASDYWTGSLPETKSNVLSALSSGNYGFVNHIGHGFFYNMSVGSASLELGDVESLRNEDHYFILNGLNCASAAFDYNSIMERFVNHDRGGAVLAIGATRAAFPGTAADYQESFYNVLFNQDLETAGEVINASRTPFEGNTAGNTLERWTHMTIAMLGDPSLRVWTEIPEPLLVDTSESLEYGIQTLSVEVIRAGLPLAGATVCFSKPGDDYVVGKTDAAGRIDLSVNIKSAGEGTLTVSGRNSEPWSADLPVNDPGSPYLKLQSITVVDDGTFGSVGNGNGLADGGETIAVMLEMINSGDADMTEPATVTPMVTDPGFIILSGDLTMAPQSVGSASVCDLPLLLQIGPSVADKSIVEIDVQSTSAQLDCLDSEFLTISAPILAPGLMYWNDFPYGDGDGVVEPDENIRLTFTLRNEGTGHAGGIHAWIETDDPRVTVVQGLGNWEDLPKFTETDQLEEFIVSMTAINRQTRAVMHIEDDQGHEWIHEFDLEKPSRANVTQTSAPAGGEVLLVWDVNPEADLLGYHVYRSEFPNGPFERITFRPIIGSTFYRDTGLKALSTYFYRVAASDSSCMLGRESVTERASTIPPEKSGFPVAMYSETSSHPVVGDVNGDGDLEIVTAADAIYVWRADGTELRDGDSDPLTLGPFAGAGLAWAPSGVTLGNLTNRPGMEIVASCKSQAKIYVFNGDGSVADGWPQSMSSWNWATPTVGDLDNDGDLEIIVSNVVGYTYIWHHDGTEFYDGDNNPATHGVFHIRSSEWYTMSSPAVADVDGDGTLEVLLASRYTDAKTDYLYAFKNDHSQAAGWPYSLTANGNPQCSPAVADMNNDGILEIVLVTENNYLHVIDQYGDAVAPFPKYFVSNSASTGVSCPSPALGDLDPDGNLDIVVVSVLDNHTSYIYAYNLDGDVLPGWPVYVEGNSEGSPLIGDITGDGLLDIVFGIGGGTDSVPNHLLAYKHTGSVIPGFPLSLDGPLRSTPTLCDLEGDGDVDIVYGGWDLAMHVWDLPGDYVKSLMPWPEFGANPLRTGVFAQDWNTSVEETPPFASTLILHQNVPNPFNPATRISFDLPVGYDGRVRLTVYDLMGRSVRRLLDTRLQEGRHAADWRGLNDDGEAQSSGVYVFRLQTATGSANGRMLLLR